MEQEQVSQEDTLIRELFDAYDRYGTDWLSNVPHETRLDAEWLEDLRVREMQHLLSRQMRELPAPAAS